HPARPLSRYGRARGLDWGDRQRSPSGVVRYHVAPTGGSPDRGGIVGRTARDSHGDVLWYEGIAENVTERLRREAVVRRAERMASLGHTLAGVAHELNNPLAAISGFAQILLKTNLPKEDRSAIETVHREAKRAAKIGRDLLRC